MGKLGKIRKYLAVIGEGNNLKSKISIAFYFLRLPLSYLFGKNENLIFNTTVKNKYGIFFCGRKMSSVWIGSSFHEPAMKRYFNLKEGTFVDVGANIGKYTVILGKMLKNKGNVLSIEPEKNNLKILKRNIKLNKLDNVLVRNLACSEKEGEINFYVDQESSGGHSINKNKNFKKITVKTSKLDSIISDLNLKDINLIKIDVEGAEGSVLKGSLKTLNKFHPKIISEAWDEKRLKVIEDILKPFNYKTKKIGDIDYLSY